MKWSTHEFNEIVQADGLHISPFRKNGRTYGTPTWVWCVSVDGDLYVRAYNGQHSSWYQAALSQMAGQIVIRDMTKEVLFESVEGIVNKRIDTAYREKYPTSPYLMPMISRRAREATVRIIPKYSDGEQ